MIGGCGRARPGSAVLPDADRDAAARASSRPSLRDGRVRVAPLGLRRPAVSRSLRPSSPMMRRQAPTDPPISAGQLGGLALLPVRRADRARCSCSASARRRRDRARAACRRSCRTAGRRRASMSRRPATPARAIRWRRSRRRRDVPREQRTTPRARSRLRPSADCPSAPVSAVAGDHGVDQRGGQLAVVAGEVLQLCPVPTELQRPGPAP